MRVDYVLSHHLQCAPRSARVAELLARGEVAVRGADGKPRAVADGSFQLVVGAETVVCGGADAARPFQRLLAVHELIGEHALAAAARSGRGHADLGVVDWTVTKLHGAFKLHLLRAQRGTRRLVNISANFESGLTSGWLPHRSWAASTPTRRGWRSAGPTAGSRRCSRIRPATSRRRIS